MNDQLSLINQTCAQIKPIEDSWLTAASEWQLTLTKPPGSLGRLEEIGNRLAAIQQTIVPAVSRKRVYVVAGDHGVTAEGVSAYPREVTAQMVANFLGGGAAINVLARNGAVEVKVVDAGVDGDLGDHDNLIPRKIVRGTANFALGPAMTTTEAQQAVAAGIELARDAHDDGIHLIGIGEMGIGNTTAASAIAAVLTSSDPAMVTGRGTGVDDQHLAIKVETIRRALVVNSPDRSDPLNVLAKVGGAEIGVMMGMVLGGAANRLAVVADGFISSAAAALAVALCPCTRGYLMMAHRSSEPGHTVLMDFIGDRPLLDLSMRLGEGTGAVLAMHLIDGAARLLTEMATFQQAGVSNRE
jgi:nicotinate-nucleotide--dimethylbenzimidazole phosphoribosyltransferase